MMQYNIKAHPTKYNGVLFRSRLEARWAAFFDLVEWNWEYEPIDIHGWTPDFRVTFPCGHSECGGHHILFVEVKPYYHLREFKGHPCMDYPFGCKVEGEYITSKSIPADASAAFGVNPDVTYWEMCHGSGGGLYRVDDWVNKENIVSVWKQAGEMVQYKPGGKL